MSITSGLSTTLDIVNIAGSLLHPTLAEHARGRDQHEGAKKLVQSGLNVAKRLDRVGGAITSMSAQTTILARSFVDELIIDEPILPNLNRSIHSWYGAQIISALMLSQMITEHRTVQDVMSVIQTGHNRHEQSLLANVANRKHGMESFLERYTGKVAEEHVGLESIQGPLTHNQMNLANKSKFTEAAKAGGHNVREDISPSDRDNSVSVRSVDTADNRLGPMGELYEVKLTNPNDKNASTTVPVFIQMQPSIIPAAVAPRFIDMNVSQSTWQRWTMMRAGELTFWRDFVLNRDLFKRQKSLIKDPVTAKAFSDFLGTVAKKDKYAIDDVTNTYGARQSSNLANSVVIFSEDTVLQAKVDSGIDLHKVSDRERYFRDTYTMIVAIVDPLHQRVMVYFNGLDGSIDASYSEFRPKDQKFDPKDFMTALQTFSSNGNVGRLR